MPRTFANVMNLLSQGASAAVATCKSLMFWKISEQEYRHAEELLPVIGHLMTSGRIALILSRVTNQTSTRSMATTILSALPAVLVEYANNTDKLDDRQKTILLITAFSLQTLFNWLDYRYNKAGSCGLDSLALLTVSIDSLQSALSIIAMTPGSYAEGLFAPSPLPGLTEKVSLVTTYAEGTHAAATAISGLSHFISKQCVEADDDDAEEDDIERANSRARVYLNLDHPEPRIQV